MSLAYGQLGKEHFLFSGGPAGVTVWSIAADGTLSTVAGSPFDGGEGAEDFLGTAVVKKGKKLYVYSSVFGLDAVIGFEVMPGGTLEELPDSPYAADAGPDGLDSDGKLVAALCESAGTLATFKVQKDGSLEAAPGSPADVDANGYNVQLDLKGKVAYVASSDGSVYAYSVNKKTGDVTALPDAPFDSGLDSNNDGTEILKKKFVFVFRFNSVEADPDISVMERDKKGQLSLVGRQISGLAGIAAHAVDAKDRFLVVVNDDGSTVDNVRCFAFDKKTGAMLLTDSVQADVDGVNDAAIVEL
jgi:6-phosphogluconolactonase (cycloisomerase 2 family)